MPSYLRTGKRMHGRTSKIVNQFRPVPHSIFPSGVGRIVANRLVIHLQPDESVAGGHGEGARRPAAASVALKLSFAEAFQTCFVGAYKRLLMDGVRGYPTLFMRRGEVVERVAVDRTDSAGLSPHPAGPPHLAGGDFT